MRRLLAAAMLLAGGVAASAAVPSELIFFGDSLTDNGNLFDATGGTIPAPPNFQGRFADGPVWSDRLPRLLGQPPLMATVMAIGGAQSGAGQFPPGLLLQVDLFLGTFPELDEDALVLIAIGGNDYLEAARQRNDSGTPVLDNDPAVTAVVDNIEQAIREMAAAGTRRLVVGNVPGLHRFPVAAAEGLQEELAALISQHNAMLAGRLPALESELALDIRLLDLEELIDRAFADPEEFGFTNLTTPCWNGVAFSTPCANPEERLFWDALHPTAAAHEVLASVAAALILEQERARQDSWLVF